MFLVSAVFFFAMNCRKQTRFIKMHKPRCPGAVSLIQVDLSISIADLQE
jgi:hypothetical protein